MTIFQVTGAASITFSSSGSGRSSIFVNYQGGRYELVAEERRHVPARVHVSKSGRTLVRFYQVIGTLEPELARQALPVIDSIDGEYPDYSLTDIDIIRVATGGKVPHHCCRATLTYTAALPSEEITDPATNRENRSRGGGGGSTRRPGVTFTIDGETQTLFEAIDQTTYESVNGAIIVDPIPGGESEDRTIGKQSNGEVQGVEVDKPIIAFAEKFDYPEDAMTPSERRRLMTFVKKVNDGTFRGFEAGEVKLDSMTMEKEGRRWVVEFSFQVRLNTTETYKLWDNELGTYGTVILESEGWQYEWLSYLDVKQTTEYTTRVPEKVGISTVYKYADFSDIGIGTEPML